MIFEWTKTPPTEPGFYRVWLKSPSLGVVATVAELSIDRVLDRPLRSWWLPGIEWEVDIDDIDWFWPEPIEFPPLPENTNAPDQAGA
jgi:hypothetical protein